MSGPAGDANGRQWPSSPTSAGRHASRRRRRLREPEAAAHHDRWLVSYADLITLLFAFFTVLYAISTVDKTKAQHAAESMASALRVSQQPSPPAAPVAAPPATVAAEAPPPTVVNPLVPLAAELTQVASSPALHGRVQVSLTRRGVVVSLAEAGFFEPGKSDVRPDALDALDELSASLRRHDDGQKLQLTVEGHTDDTPLRAGGRYHSNWELSTARATAVVARLVERHHYAPGRLSAAGYGEWRPMAPNDTVEGRAKNRRVDVLVRLADGDEP